MLTVGVGVVVAARSVGVVKAVVVARAGTIVTRAVVVALISKVSILQCERERLLCPTCELVPEDS